MRVTQETEDDIETTACQIAWSVGYVTRKVKWVGRRSAMDRAFIGQGRFILIEFKRPGKRLEGLQRNEFQRFRRRYRDVWACWSAESACTIMGIPRCLMKDVKERSLI